MAAQHTHSRTLFMTRDGAPVRFYVRPGPTKRQLAPLIAHGGGVVCRIQEPGAFLLADPAEGHLGPDYISTTYITDCVSSNRGLSPRPYRLMPPWGLKTRGDQRRSPDFNLTPGEAMGNNERLAVDPASSAAAGEQGHREDPTTSMATREEAAGEREDNVEKRRSTRKASEQDQHRKSPTSGRGFHTETSSESVEDLRTEEREDNLEKRRSTPRKASDKDEDQCRKTPSRRSFQTEASSESVDDLRTEERKDNLEKKRSTPRKASHKDEDQCRKTPASRRGFHTEVSSESVENLRTGVREDNLEKRRSTPRKASDKDEDQHKKSPASRRGFHTEASFESVEDLRTEETKDNLEKKRSTPRKASDKEEGQRIRVEATTGVKRDDKNCEGTAASRSQCSGPPLNEAKNYNSSVILDPRSSTPASGNPNTVKDLENETPHVSVILKDGESPPETQFRRPKRKVADKKTLSVEGDRYSPGLKQKRAENQTDVHTKPSDETQMSANEAYSLTTLPLMNKAQMSKLGSHGTKNKTEEQTAMEEGHSAESPAGQMEHTAEQELGAECAAKEMDVQTAENQKVQSGFSHQGHKAAAALRRGRTAFTKEEDMAILLYIRDHVSSSRTVTGNVLWIEMEKKKVLGRTWQAMKTRYVKYLTNQNHRYKLPPKSPCPPIKNSSQVQGSPKSNHSLLNGASTSTMTPQKCDATLPSASADIPQNCDTIIPSTSVGSPKKLDSMLPSGSTDAHQKDDAMPPTISADTLQKCDTILPSVSAAGAQKPDAMLPNASTDSPQKCYAMLPSASADTPRSSGIRRYGSCTAANTLVTNNASKERSILTPKKRSSDPTKHNESSLQTKGNKMSFPHSDKTLLPDREDSGDSEDLHIFQRANMEFEETDDDLIPQQPAPEVSHAKDNNESASHVDETPSTSQALESKGLQEAMMDMMKEFRIDVSSVTQALFFNSGELGSTRHFLLTGARPDGYPIWEPRDDLDLKVPNPKMQSHLIKKYGADNVARRVAFLAS